MNPILVSNVCVLGQNTCQWCMSVDHALTVDVKGW